MWPPAHNRGKKEDSMVDPSQMTDEELNKVIETGIEPEEPTSEPQEAEQEVEKPQEVEEEAQVEEPAQEEVETKDPDQPSRREQLRIQQLLKKYGTPRERAPEPSKPVEQLNYQETLDADPEVIAQLEQDRRSFAEQQYARGQQESLKQVQALKWETSLKIDAPNVEKKFPVLDPQSSEFHPAVADAVNSWYLNMSGFDQQTGQVANPNISYADFVESFMELTQEVATQKNTQSVKNIAKQAASTGLRPDGSSAKRLNLNKSEKDMSLEELYAAIGQTPPKQ